MITKRTSINEYNLKCFLSGETYTKSSKFNGMLVYELKKDTLYGSHVIELPTYCGVRILQVNLDNIKEISNEIQEIYYNIEKIYESKESFSNYCANNAWTRSGT